MARTRLSDTGMPLDSWDAVDMTLAEIGEHERAVEAIEAQMQADIADRKLAAEIAASPHQQRIVELGALINRFVDEHRDEMDGKKTKVLTFGSTGYRKSTKVLLPRAQGKIREIIASLKARGMTDCIVVPAEKIDKDALKKYPANEIMGVGANLHAEDIFWYEVDRERLAQKQ